MTYSPSSSGEPSDTIQQNKFISAKEAIFSARDNIIEAYKSNHTKLLDLLNIFRSLTESTYHNLSKCDIVSSTSNSRGRNSTPQSLESPKIDQNKRWTE